MADKEGLPGLNIIEIPHPLGGLSKEIIQQRANSIVDNIISALTVPTAKAEPRSQQVAARAGEEIIKVSGRTAPPLSGR